MEKGSISMHAARHLADLPPGEERNELKKRVAAARDKKKAKSIVGERKRRKKQQSEFGTLKMPGLTGAYSTLLAVLESVLLLPTELQNLRNAPNPLSVKHACELRAAIEGLKMLDPQELFDAADVALLALDRMITRSNIGASEEQGAKTSDMADALQRKAS